MPHNGKGGDLQRLLDKKIQLDLELCQTEKQIYDLESSYVEETSQYGNVIKGWEHYLGGGQTGGGGNLQINKKMRVKETERIFSSSSATYVISLEKLAEKAKKKSHNKLDTVGSGKASKKSSKKKVSAAPLEQTDSDFQDE